jgi:hypothetical protein
LNFIGALLAFQNIIVYSRMYDELNRIVKEAIEPRILRKIAKTLRAVLT